MMKNQKLSISYFQSQENDKLIIYYFLESVEGINDFLEKLNEIIFDVDMNKPFQIIIDFRNISHIEGVLLKINFYKCFLQFILFNGLKKIAFVFDDSYFEEKNILNLPQSGIDDVDLEFMVHSSLA